MLNKRGIILVTLVFLLSIDVFAQGFGFDFQYGRRAGSFGAGSGISNAISSALDLIFGGIIGPVFDAVRFNFYGAVKLALWIVLYLIFANVFKNFFSGRGMHPKFAKVIAAIIALFSVVFIPERLLDLIFRDLLGGLVGLLLLVAVVALPLYYLFKWSGENKEDRAVNLVSAFLFFLLMIVFSELHNQFVYAFNYGWIQSLTSLIVTFGIIFALIMFIHRLYLGFKGMGGNKEAERGKEDMREEEKDEFEGVKGHAHQLIGNLNNIREHIHSLSNNIDQLALELRRNPERLNVVGPTTAHSIYSNVNSLVRMLESVKGKKKGKVANIVSKISKEYDDLRHHLEQFHLTARGLRGQLNAWHSTGNLNRGYFGDVNKKLKDIDKEVNDLIGSLSEVETL